MPEMWSQTEVTYADRRLLRLPALLASLAVLVALVLPAAARAQLVVDVTEGHLDPLPIAIVDFVGQTSEERELGAEIAGIVENNLRSSGLFRPLDDGAFIENITNIDLRPRFSDWRVINADALLVGRVRETGDGRLLVAVRLWDTASETQLVGFQFTFLPEASRRVAHQISDRVYERLTGETGYFDTHIVYVSESAGPDGEPVRRLVLMDQDGFNPRPLTSRRYMALLPNFSPTNQQITYVSFRDQVAQSYLYEINTGREERLFDFGSGSNRSGQSLAARFHPDGDELVAAIERNGDHNVYRYQLASGEIEPLTSSPADDVEPSYSPDGEQVVFSSTRGGASQLYVMSADGSNPRRITFGEGRYNTPVWSPRGDLIAFTKQQGGLFALGVVSADGSGRERILYEGYFVDTPAWSPNGRVLLFTRGERTRNGPRHEIWSVDLAGFNLRRMPIAGNSSDPAWSPLLD